MVLLCNQPPGLTLHLLSLSVACSAVLVVGNIGDFVGQMVSSRRGR